ncbi:SDH family Clp fold serine proteinase [Shewanella baltica]|uniref:SDH family Clp fold serine proteinase n=1 Tax=Shewanella baltica TaxID=62322 RepID=UPI003D78F979
MERVSTVTDVVTEVETEVATEVETEVATEVETEVTTKVETEVTTEVETEVTTEVETEVTTKVETEVTTEVETEVTTKVETEVAAEISMLPEVDVINYLGPISHQGYLRLTEIIENKIQTDSKAAKLLLVLTTAGGEPDAAYRIGSAVNFYYDSVTIMIPDRCKSAGTLIAIAASELIVGDLGELGPLDIQLRKSDEMGEQSSTLNIFKTIEELQQTTIESFRHFVTDIRFGTGIGTKLAADIASNLVESLISPIAAQIDPMKLGEHNRALQIAKDYATRLNKLSDNLKSIKSLEQLISGYPCHSFVIDRKEAKLLFNRVRGTIDEEEELLYRFARLYMIKMHQSEVYLKSGADVQDFASIIKYVSSSKGSDETK